MGSSLTAARGARSRVASAAATSTWIEGSAKVSVLPDRTETKSRRATPSGRIVTARAGDHPAIHRLLVSVLHRPNDVEFQLSTDRPGYEPSDRLLLLRDQDLVAHVRLSSRLLRFGSTWMPACDLAEFACLPEYRLLGDDAALLAVAEAQAATSGAILATTLTDQPGLFAESGWLVAGGARCLRANPRTLLARLSRCGDVGPSRRRRHHSTDLVVRPWRYVEQHALQELYRETAGRLGGALRRDAAYWEWLLVRRGFEQILVAALPPQEASSSEVEQPETIVAYAFTRGSDVVEMFAAPDHPEAAHELLQRVASEAIERDAHEIRLFQPPSLEATTESEPDLGASGDASSTKRTPQQMVKLLNPQAFLQQHSSRIAQSARAAGVTAGTRLGLQLNHWRITLHLEPDQPLRWTEGLATRRCVRASGAGVTAVLLGLLGQPGVCLGESLEMREVDRELVGRLFPRQGMWRSPLDDLPSMTE